MTTLSEVRVKLAAVLAPIGEDAPPVHIDLPDAISPPCLILSYGEPMLGTIRVCTGMAHPDVVCVAGRLEPGAGLSTLETIVQETLRRIVDSGSGFSLRADVTGPRLFDHGGIHYIATRIPLQLPVAF